MTWNGEFRVLNHSENVTELFSSGEPFGVPEEENEVWYEVHGKVVKYIRSKSRKESFAEDPYELTLGTVHLINHILSREKSSPVQTLVFLDKSGRLGGSLLRYFWTYLQERGKISAEIKLPKIRFIDIGTRDYRKYESKMPAKMASKIFSSADIPKEGVLIVDEVFSSGNTAKKAQQFFKQEYGAKVQVIEQFRITPAWYADLSLLGTADVSLGSAVYSFFENLSKSEFSLLEKLVSEFSAHKDENLSWILNFPMGFSPYLLEEYFHGPYFEEYVEFFSEYDFSKKEVEKIFLLLGGNKNFKGESIIDYLETKGGFLTQKTPHLRHYQKAVLFRSALKELARLASEHVFIQPNSNYDPLEGI